MSIVVNALTYVHPNGELLFDNLSFSILKGDKVALVGHNGVGKSTLFRILAGELIQSKGEVVLSKSLYYMPQHFGQFDEMTAMEILRIQDKINALHAILAGNVTQDNLDLLNDDWDIEERVNKAFAYWDIDGLPLSTAFASLSGGEKTKLLLSGIQIHMPDIILMDEPSNHLDKQSRVTLYKFIEETNSTLLIVSHDRTLLNRVNTTFELTSKAIEVYGGNYDFYREQKQIKLNALHAQLAEKEKSLKQTVMKSREIAEQRQKQESRGKAQKEKSGVPRIVMGKLQNNAEQSSAKSKKEQIEKIEDIVNEIKLIKQTIEREQLLKIQIVESGLHKGKVLVSADNINIHYGEQPLWKHPLSFQVYSGDRILIEGNNGVGKTSLIRLITKETMAYSGQLFVAEFNYLYIDQEYSILKGDLTIFEQAQKFNDKHLPEHALKMLLHRHQLSQSYWDRPCHTLSGGEKMKLLLCCLSISNNNPDMLIFDEPTNNLDIYSKEILTYSIKHFNGTILVISHDQQFIEDIGIEKVITL